MRKLYLTLITTVIAASGLGTALAQDGNFNVDSFFDITYEIDFPELPDPPLTEECMDCEALLKLIREKEAELGDLVEEAEGVLREAKDLRNDINKTKSDLEAAKKRLDDFNNPKSWAESGDRRVTSTDLEVGRAYNRALWEQYQNGALTAQELSDAWEQGLTDKEKERLKRKIQKQLEKEVKEAENKLKGLEAREKILGGKLKDLDGKIAKLKEELAKLWEQYLDCLKRCAEKKKVNLIDDYGFAPEDDGGLFGWLKDFFVKLVGADTPDPIETEIIQLDLQGTSPLGSITLPPIDVSLPTSPSTGTMTISPPDISDLDLPADSFFDVFFEIDLPELPPIPPQPVCAACEELAKKLDALEAEIDNMEDDVAGKINKLENEKNKLTQAEKDLQRAKDALDRFNNPSGWAESGERRIDTTDLEVMREHNRNLWGQYRNGDLSAEELEQEWEEGLSDKERDKLKKKMKEKLEKEVEKKQKEADRLSDVVKKLSDEVNDMRKKLADMIAEFNKLLAEFEDCIKKCIEQGGELILIGDPVTDDDDEMDDDDDDDDDDVDDDDQPPSKNECKKPSLLEHNCRKECTKGDCIYSYTNEAGGKCFKCEQKPEEKCPSGTDIEADGPFCSRCPSGECRNLKELSDGTYCLQCIAEDTGPQCPSGTTSDKGVCEDNCPSNGVCVLEGDCYSCLVVQCPGGTSKDKGECQSSCDGTCEVAASQHGVDCWQCKLDCNQTCAQNGYNPGETDYTNQILAELNGYQCVSGAGISITTATIGDCFCTKDPVIDVDTTPPVCRGTPCGDVECNGSATCSEGNTTFTVTCNWGGWEKFAPNQFRPILNAGGQ